MGFEHDLHNTTALSLSSNVMMVSASRKGGSLRALDSSDYVCFLCRKIAVVVRRQFERGR